MQDKDYSDEPNIAQCNHLTLRLGATGQTFDWGAVLPLLEVPLGVQ